MSSLNWIFINFQLKKVCIKEDFKLVLYFIEIGASLWKWAVKILYQIYIYLCDTYPHSIKLEIVCVNAKRLML